MRFYTGSTTSIAELVGKSLFCNILRYGAKLAPGEQMGATGTAHGPAAALQPARSGLAFCSKETSRAQQVRAMQTAGVVLLGPTLFHFEPLSFSPKCFCFNGSAEEIVYLPTEGFRKHDLIIVKHFIFFLLQAMGN